MYRDEDVRDLFPTRGQPAQEPWRLALVTLMQDAEGLTERQAADAVRTRIDWKYAVSLELTSTGFDCCVLSALRSRLLAKGAQRRLFDLLLSHFGERGWIKARGKQRTWRRMYWPLCARGGGWNGWGRRCAIRWASWQKLLPAGFWSTWSLSGPIEMRNAGVDFRLPKDAKARVALAETIGADGRRLLERVSAETSLPWLAELEAVETLRRVWMQHDHARARPGLA